MKTFLKITVLIALLMSTASCFVDGVKGNGTVVTESRKISDDFVRLEVSRGLEVYLTKSKSLSLEVEADENLQDLITTEVKDGTLTISSRKNIWRSSSKKVHLSVDNLNEIDLNSGAEVYTENTFTGKELRLKASSGASAKMHLNIEDLNCETSSGSDAVLSGKALYFSASSSSGSDIKAYDLEARHCTASASSGSDIKVFVTGEFEAKASSGADIKFKGDPSVVKQDDNSGGSVKNIQG